MERLTVEKPVKEMNMMELAHNCMFAKNRWAWYRDYEGEKDLMELIREINVVIGGSEIPENNALLEEVLQDNLQYSLSDKDGLIAFIYQSLWTKANLRERLKEYEDTDITPGQIREIDSKCVDMFGVGLMASVEKFGEFFEEFTEYIKYQREKENGLLLRLPCKIGDTVYVLMKRCNVTEIVKGTVKKVYSTISGIWWIEFRDLWLDVEFKDFGETAFLTREEAEAKLAEVEGGHE